MNAFIKPTFWSDPLVERLDAEARYVMLWLITNPQTSVVGICEVSEKRFAFETGLPPEALTRAKTALQGAIVFDGDKILLKNFIRHQWGTGKRLTANNVFRTILSTVEALGEDSKLFKALLDCYSEIRSAITPNSEALNRAKDREGRGGEVQGGKEEVTEEEVVALEVLHHLNTAADRHFEAVPSNLSLIKARLKEVNGDVAGVKQMITRWVKKWTGTPHEEYLQPSTLFAVKKFQERYANRNLPVIQETAPPHIRLKSIDDELRRHVANVDGPRFNRECSQAEKDNYAHLKKQRAIVNALVAQGGQR